MSTSSSVREGQGPTQNLLRLDSGLATCLCQSVALNTTANLRVKPETSAPSFPFLFTLPCQMYVEDAGVTGVCMPAGCGDSWIQVCRRLVGPWHLCEPCRL